MWYLLLLVPAMAIAMAVVARFGTINDTDRACTAIDLRLDREKQLVIAGATTQQPWVPVQRKVSRVAPRTAPVGGELLAG